MIDCHCIRKIDNACMHHMAPVKWRHRVKCVLVYPPADRRHVGCALQYSLKDSNGYPTFPPSTIRSDWSLDELKVPPNGCV